MRKTYKQRAEAADRGAKNVKFLAASTSIEDFRQRIARIIREQETGKKFSIIGAAMPRKNVVR